MDFADASFEPELTTARIMCENRELKRRPILKLKKALAVFLGLTLISISAHGQTGKKLKLDPKNTAATMITNTLSESLLLMATPAMVDPAIDRGSTVFSYFAKPVHEIGLPGSHFATMVTPEGRLFNGAAEMVFFAKDFRPLNQRIYTLLDGWLPCIEYQVEDRGLVYQVQAFQY